MYGAEAVILNLLGAMRNGPYTGALAVFRHAGAPAAMLCDRAAAEGFEVHEIRCKGQLDRTVSRALRALVQRTGTELVHSHGYKADVYTWLALRGSRTALVATCHTWYDNDLALRCYGALDRWVLRSYAGVAAVSEDVQQRLVRAGVKERRIRLVRNGIDPKPFTRARELRGRVHGGGLRVGLVGRLAPEKGADIFLRAAARVIAELPEIDFEVAGDGPDREALQSLITELGIGARARLVGRQEDMPGYYASLDLMVSASRHEGLPIALLEGMACGLPLVGTSVGAVPSVVLDHETGLLVPPENVVALATAMMELLRDDALRARYGAAARKRVIAEFSAQRMTEEYLDMYAQALK
jgi:glycosyltransferase involved in cell wall biosynthesis